MAPKSYKVAIIPGDGIGKEVMPEALKVLETSSKKHGFTLETETFNFASCDYYVEHKKMMPDNWLEVLSKFDVLLFGAVGDPARVPDHISLWGSLLLFRREFDQYVNLRPCRLIPGVPTPLKNPGNVDFWIVRENTEGEYSEIGGRIFAGTERETVVQQTIMTRIGVDRILKYAFDLAQSRPAKNLTSATKSNGISITMPFWDERVAEMHKSYPDITVNSYHIDALTTYFVSRPASFDVVVGSNLFGDILSDLGPALTGSLGVAASGNINPTGKFPSLFEPVHGSAPDIAGKYIANPVGMIEAASMMLRHLGEAEAADEIIAAINAVLARANSAEVTRDLGGQAKTEALGDAINKELLGRS